jgi:disulfide bond formation protein DsbB
MDVQSVQLFTALLTFLALAGAVLLVLARVLASRWPLARDLGGAVAEAGLWLAFLVAATATLGSLYFSESAGYVPCTMCWYQRIAMYPLAPILLIAAIRRDRWVAWYATPLASVGAGIALYHYLIEWNPSLEGGACSATGPSCADIWFREFGFVTLPFMALAGFLAILAFLLVSFGGAADTVERAEDVGAAGDEESPDRAPMETP